MATKWKFKITKDPYKRDKDGVIFGVNQQFFGIYEDSPHLGECPIGNDRLIPHKELVEKEIEICDHCGRPMI